MCNLGAGASAMSMVFAIRIMLGLSVTICRRLKGNTRVQEERESDRNDGGRDVSRTQPEVQLFQEAFQKEKFGVILTNNMVPVSLRIIVGTLEFAVDIVRMTNESLLNTVAESIFGVKDGKNI